MKPGDKIQSPDGGSWTVLAPLAYQGKEGCESAICTRIGFVYDHENKKVIDRGRCVGWHCAVCDEPCSSQGHSKCASIREALADVERNEADPPTFGKEGR